MAASATASPKPSRFKKLLLLLGVAVVVLVLGVALLGPTIAGSLAPGIIASKAGGAIKGKVTVKSVATGWKGPTTVSGIEVRDEQGALVGTLDATSSLGILDALGSMSDLGKVGLKGKLDLVRTIDDKGNATTNLQQAIAPKNPPTPSSASSGASKDHALPDLTVKLDLQGVDATYTEKDAKGAVLNQAAMKNLTGSIDLATRAGGGHADVLLDAGFTGSGSTGTMHVDAKVKNLTDAKGELQLGKLAIDKGDVKIVGAPTKLLDALAGQNGVIAEALGPTADVNISLKGALPTVTGDVKLTSPNTNADLALESRDGRITATRPGTIKVQSLAFVRTIPAVRDALAGAGMTIDANAWPGVNASITSLNLPSDPNGSWAGARLEASAFTTGDIRGTLVRPSAKGAPANLPEPMVIKPITLSILAPDMAKGAEVIGNTSATISGQSAGDIDLLLDLGELVTADGKFLLMQGGLPAKLTGKLTANHVATSLLTPFAAGTGLPLDLPVDLGPTVDVSVQTRTVGGMPGTPAPAGQLPPTDIDLTLNSANVQAVTHLALTPTGLATRDNTTRVVIASATPALTRFLNKNATPPAGAAPLTLTGAGRIEISASEIRLPMIGGTYSPELLTAQATASITDLTAHVPGATPLDVGATALNVQASVKPREATPLKIDGGITLNGAPATVAADLKIDGLMNTVAHPALPGLGIRRVQGTARVENLSGQALQKLALRPDSSAALRDLLAELVGDRVTVDLVAGAGTYGVGQPLKITLTGATTGELTGELKPDALDLHETDLHANVTPGVARSVLALAGQKGEAMKNLTLRAPTQLDLHLPALTVPLKSGTFEPQWSRGNQLITANVSLRQPAIVDGLVVDGRPVTAGVANFTIAASAPLSLLDQTPGADTGKPATINATMDLIGNGTADLLARLRVTGGTKPDGTDPRIDATISDVATARVDEIIGKPGLLAGALGDRANLNVIVNGAGRGSSTRINGEIKAPRLEADKLQFSWSADAATLTAPVRVKWQADPAFVDRFVLGGEPGKPPATRLSAPVDLQLDIKALSFSMPTAATPGKPATGPMRPGAFALDAVAQAPTILLTRAGGVTTELSRVLITTKNSGGAGVTFDATIGAMRDGAAAITEPANVRGSVDNLADANGIVDFANATVNLTANTGTVPTAVVDSLTGQDGELVKLLGPQLSAKIDAKNVSKRGSGGMIAAELKSPKATVAVGGPVVDGLLDTTAPGATPFKLELSEFNYTAEGKMLKLFPMFASISRTQSKDSNLKPSTIISRGLKFPVDGDMSRLNGDLDVDVGRIDYVFSKSFGDFMEETIFRGGRGADQRPVPPFVVSLRNGVASYGSKAQKILIPVRNQDFFARGQLDFVKREVDVVTYIPTVAVAPGVMTGLNKQIGGAVGSLFPDIVKDLTALPLRSHGPMDNPTTGIDFGVIKDELGAALKPANIIDNLLKPKDGKGGLPFQLPKIK